MAMEITTVYYRTDTGYLTTDKPFVVRDGGIVVRLSENSSIFLPYSQIVRIEQTLVGDDWNEGDKEYVSLNRRMGAPR